MGRNEIEISPVVFAILSPNLFDVFGEEVKEGNVKVYFEDGVVFMRKASSAF